MDEILKIILDYGLTGGAMLVISYALILKVKYQERRDSQFFEILGKMDARLATIEEQNRNTKMVEEDLVEAVNYCRQNNNPKKK